MASVDQLFYYLNQTRQVYIRMVSWMIYPILFCLSPAVKLNDDCGCIMPENCFWVPQTESQTG